MRMPRCGHSLWGMAYRLGSVQPALRRPSMSASTMLSSRWKRRKTGPVEQSLIEPLAARYPSADPDAVTPVWNDSYAAAMRQVYRDHPDDHDVAALFAEAIMN